MCVCVLLTEPGVLGSGYQNWSALLTLPSVSAAPFLPARQPTAAPEPTRQKNCFKRELKLGQYNMDNARSSI